MKQAVLVIALALAARHEAPQAERKPFAAKSQTLVRDQSALATRARKQDEYVRTGDMP